MAKVLISMRDDFLQRIDEVAEQEQRTRSELIRQALRHYLMEHRQSKQDLVLESMLIE